jgi:hypothetical protein
MEADAWVASSGNHQPSVAFSLQSVGRTRPSPPRLEFADKAL